MPDIDFSRYALIGVDFFVDCNAKVVLGVAKETSAKVYTQRRDPPRWRLSLQRGIIS
ncbi:MAG: hypothetical protein J4G05_09300 [Chlorobi bacterium]|nr:hypothetical protein [Chlorobiota bacterium]